MKSREFNKIIRSCCDKKSKTLDLDKLLALPLDQRREMGLFVVRQRHPILIELAEGLDEDWLCAMGYLHRTESPTKPGFVFRHTSENIIR